MRAKLLDLGKQYGIVECPLNLPREEIAKIFKKSEVDPEKVFYFLGEHREQNTALHDVMFNAKMRERHKSLCLKRLNGIGQDSFKEEKQDIIETLHAMNITIRLMFLGLPQENFEDMDEQIETMRAKKFDELEIDISKNSIRDHAASESRPFAQAIARIADIAGYILTLISKKEINYSETRLLFKTVGRDLFSFAINHSQHLPTQMLEKLHTNNNFLFGEYCGLDTDLLLLKENELFLDQSLLVLNEEKADGTYIHTGCPAGYTHGKHIQGNLLYETIKFYCEIFEEIIKRYDSGSHPN